jgi:hypothetical protein
MVPPCSRAGASRRSGAVECIVIGVSEAREARWRLALTRPAVPLNIAARSSLLLLYTSSVFGRKSKLAWLPRAYRTPMMPCCRPTARGLKGCQSLCPIGDPWELRYYRIAVVLGAAAACPLDVGDGPAAPCAQSNCRLEQDLSVSLGKVAEAWFCSFAFSRTRPRAAAHPKAFY